MDPDKTVRHDEPVPVEKPVCEACGADLDARGDCMDRCTREDTKPDAPKSVRQG